MAAFCTLLAGGCTTSTTMPASEAPVRVVGRAATTDDGSLTFDWSGVYIDIRFHGSYLAMEVSDTKRNYFNLTVDGELQEKLTVEGERSLVVLFDGAEGDHVVRIQKATEAEQGRTTIHCFTTDGAFSPIQERIRRPHIEFYGDSLTCGYGTESKSGDEPFLPETENCLYAYAALTAEAFGADYNLVSHSGRGLIRNYGDSLAASDPATTMSGRAFRLFDEDPASMWNFDESSYRPDAIVITLGTNDFSTQPHPTPEAFVAGYRALIEQIRAKWNAELPVLCVVHSPYAVDCVKAMVATIDKTAMADISWGVYNRTTDLGASEHPNRFGQQKMAAIVIEAFSELTGWSLQE